MSPAVSARREPRRGLGFGILLVCGATLAGAAPPPAPSFQLPPLQSPAGSEHHPGKIIWMELVTPDLEGAQHFYGGLFGWTFQAVAGTRSPYCIALDDGLPVAGIVQPRRPKARRQPEWMPFMAVADVEGLRTRAVARGAKLLSPPRAYPARGEQAVFSDPQGAVFGVLASSSGDPPDELADPGEWIWASLLARDPRKDAAFYQGLFGYDVETLPSEDSSHHLLLSSEGYARASANQMPARREHPYWLAFVRVEDAAESVAKARQLGGTVITEPHLDRHGGRVAVVADPAGTPLGLMEWAQEPADQGGSEESPR